MSGWNKTSDGSFPSEGQRVLVIWKGDDKSVWMATRFGPCDWVSSAGYKVKEEPQWWMNLPGCPTEG